MQLSVFSWEVSVTKTLVRKHASSVSERWFVFFFEIVHQGNRLYKVPLLGSTGLWEVDL